MTGIVQQCLAARRELPIALAHCLATAKLGDQERQMILGRHYARLDPVGQLRVRAEMLEVKEARNGNRLAVIVNA